MKLEFRTKTTVYGTGHYLCIDTICSNCLRNGYKEALK